jgi:hypothetical protein
MPDTTADYTDSSSAQLQRIPQSFANPSHRIEQPQRSTSRPQHPSKGSFCDAILMESTLLQTPVLEVESELTR